MSATITLTRPRAGAALVTLAGEVDLAALDQLHDALTLAVGCADVVVDAAGVDFIECCALRPLLSAARTVTAGGGGLCLRDPSPAVVALLAWCSLDGELATCEKRAGDAIPRPPARADETALR